MCSKDHVECWLLEYACHFGYSRVIQAIGERHNGDLHSLRVPPVRMAQVALGNIVENEGLEDFDTAVELVDQIYQSTEKLVSFKHYAKLIASLKIKYLFHMLSTGDHNVLAKLNQFFPRAGHNYQFANKKTLTKLNASQSQFRKFFLPLLANENQRLAYLRDEYSEEFGEDFMTTVKKLTQNFLKAIEANMPPTTLEKLMAASKESDIDADTEKTGVESVAMEIVLESIEGKEQLTCENMLEMLTMLNPLSTQDRVMTEHTVSLTALPDSESFDASCKQDVTVCESSPDVGASFLDFKRSKRKGGNEHDLLSEDAPNEGRPKQTEEMNNNDLHQGESNSLKTTSQHRKSSKSAEICLSHERTYGKTTAGGHGPGRPKICSTSHTSKSPNNLLTGVKQPADNSCPQTNVLSPDPNSPSLLQSRPVQRLGVRDDPTEEEDSRDDGLGDRADQVHAITSSSDGFMGASQELIELSVPPLPDSPADEITDGVIISHAPGEEDDWAVSEPYPLQNICSTSRSSPQNKLESVMDTSDVEIVVLSSEEENDNVGSPASMDKPQSGTSAMSTSLESISDIDRSTEIEDKSDTDLLVSASEVEDQVSENGRRSVQSILTDTLSDDEEENITMRKIHSGLISPFKKSANVKLCLVKLFRDKMLDMYDKGTGEETLLYS